MSIRRRFLGLSLDEVRFERRGFHGGSPFMREWLECVGGTFLHGYHLALENDSIETLHRELDGVELDARGFAFEGAAMGLALLDRLSLGRRSRIGEFLQGAGQAHVYMIHVGIGWVWARLPFRLHHARKNLDPLLAWLAFDGWGFHEGFFQGQKYLAGRPASKKLCGYQRQVFDQGLGRSFWFFHGGNVELIAKTISNFSPGRQSDLWSGIGLAATYAGIAREDSLLKLRDLCGNFHPHLAQGAAFAAKARQRAGNLTGYTELATKILCGFSAGEAAKLTDAALENLPADSETPAYEIWRHRIQNNFTPTPKLLEA